MKRTITNILIGLLFLVGFAILAYPTVSDQWNTYRQSHLIANYEKVVQEMKAEDFTAEWALARAFNSKLKKNDLYGDAFGAADVNIEKTEYWKILNVAGDGIMGYLSIPKINVRLAIYHGTAEDILQTGVGHLNGSKLPIGGESTHCVLAAHRGLPSAKLFTDVDQLRKGDMFYIYVLDQVFAYQVDQILDMVDKEDVDTLKEALSITEGEDYVSLFTCTPYGVNSHRLIVRGTRVDYDPQEPEVATTVAPDTMLVAVDQYRLFTLILGGAGTVLVIVTMKWLMDRRGRRRRAQKEAKKVTSDIK